MKAPGININGDKEGNGENCIAHDALKATTADFPINEKLLLDEVVKNTIPGYEHIQLQADESQQHSEVRTLENVIEETLLDEVAEKDEIEYPDIE